MNQIYKRNSEKEYGALSDMSRKANQVLFGDTSGRSISRQKADGLIRATGWHDLHPDAAVNIVHVTMGVAAATLSSNNRGANIVGGALLAALVACYQIGR